jgi:hypothetical protein
MCFFTLVSPRVTPSIHSLGLNVGDHVGVLVKLQTVTPFLSVKFFVNGRLFGPGFNDSFVSDTRPLVLAVQTSFVGQTVTLVPDAVEPELSPPDDDDDAAAGNGFGNSYGNDNDGGDDDDDDADEA